MKFIKSIFIVAILLVSTNALFAQEEETTSSKMDSLRNISEFKNEVYTKENIPFKVPIPYAYVREADVMFEKTIYRLIDLGEKRNLTLYYPKARIGNRMNLIELIFLGIENGEITAYDPAYEELNEFVMPITEEGIDIIFDAGTTTTRVLDADGNEVETIETNPRHLDEVKQVMIKEKIYFDKKHSVLNRQVIGICPIRVFTRPETNEVSRRKVMWVYMPEARAVFSRYPVFNPNNDAQNISYDDFFMQNRYDGYIYKVSNVHNNRSISEYASGVDALYEAQRIQNEIFDFEQDLWEY